MTFFEEIDASILFYCDMCMRVWSMGMSALPEDHALSQKKVWPRKCPKCRKGLSKDVLNLLGDTSSGISPFRWKYESDPPISWPGRITKAHRIYSQFSLQLAALVGAVGGIWATLVFCAFVLP